MIRVNVIDITEQTNPLIWPSELPVVPQVGWLIRSKFQNGVQWNGIVDSISIGPVEMLDGIEWVPNIYLKWLE